jgi:hypothetical protein
MLLSSQLPREELRGQRARPLLEPAHSTRYTEKEKKQYQHPKTKNKPPHTTSPKYKINNFIAVHAFCLIIIFNRI